MSCDTPESYGSLRDQRSNMVTSDVPKRLDTYPSPDSSVQGIKGSEFSKLPEAYASVYDRRSNVVSGEGSKKMEPLPLGTSSTIPEHFQEYVTMTPTGEPGTPEGVALANLLRRINQLEESRKENERITQEVLSLCLHTRRLLCIQCRGTMYWCNVLVWCGGGGGGFPMLGVAGMLSVWLLCVG